MHCPNPSMQVRPFDARMVAGNPNLAGAVTVAPPEAVHIRWGLFSQWPPSQLLSQAVCARTSIARPPTVSAPAMEVDTPCLARDARLRAFNGLVRSSTPYPS